MGLGSSSHVAYLSLEIHKEDGSRGTAFVDDDFVSRCRFRQGPGQSGCEGQIAVDAVVWPFGEYVAQGPRLSVVEIAYDDPIASSELVI
jgi:hypothetical protein